MEKSPQDKLIRRAVEGQKLAEKLDQSQIKEGATELFSLLIVLAEKKRYQIELLMEINEALYKAVETSDSNFVRKRIIELKLSNPLPLPIKL